MKSPTISSQDQQVVTRLEHLKAALASPVEITSDADFRGALNQTRTRTELALEAHHNAALAVADDDTQNKVVMIRFHDCASVCLEEYGWLRTQAQNTLAQPRPSRRSPRSADQAFQDQALVARAFPLSVSDLGGLGAAPLVSHLDATQRQLSGLNGLDAADVSAFQASVTALGEARQKVVDESLDDAPLMEALREARAKSAGVMVAARCILDGVLRFENSPVDVDTFILRRATPQTTDPLTNTATETATETATNTAPNAVES